MSAVLMTEVVKLVLSDKP